MADRPGPLAQLDRYFLAATIAHEYAAGIHRRLVELHADDVHTRKLLSESATVILKEMPQLAEELRNLEREWGEQELLDPSQAERTAQALEACWADVAPGLAALRTRQDRVVAELVEFVGGASRG
ncbi:MAG: hypothetical protein ACRDK4_00245 [Solirubrobacteraceae bacterium]